MMSLQPPCPQVAFERSLPAERVQHQWNALTASLGGLLCAALAQLSAPGSATEQRLQLAPNGSVHYTHHR